MPNLTNEDLWNGLCDSLTQIGEKKSSNEAFDAAIDEILSTLHQSHRQLVEQELKTIERHDHSVVSDLTAEVGLLALLYTLRTAGIAVDNGRIDSTLPPPNLQQITLELADKLATNDPMASLCLDYHPPVVYEKK